jgi:zinc protease
MAMPDKTFAHHTHRVVLSNGLTLLVYENHANPTVELHAALRAGSFLDSKEQRGVAQLTASMLMRGTQQHHKLEIAQSLEDVGADLEFHANRFLVEGEGHALSRDFDRLIATFAEVLREPSFPGEELEKLQQQTIGRIKRSQEQTHVRAYERLSQLIYPADHVFYQPPAEQRIASIESMSVDDVRDFHEKHFGASSLVLAVVGDVDALAVEKQVRQLLGDWPAGAVAEIAIERMRPHGYTQREMVEMRDKPNIDVAMGHAGQLRRIDPDYYAAFIANAALGQSTLSSRLGLRIRDQEGLTYGIVSRFLEPGFADGPWTISVTIHPENLERAIASTVEVLKSYVQEGIAEKELEEEKSSFVGSFIVGLGTNAGIATHLLSAEVFGFGPQHLDVLPDLVQAVAQEEVSAAIRRYFHPESLFIVIAGEYQKSMMNDE